MKQTEVGSYILQKMLGEGAFGRVYGGHHKLLPEVKVVIKQEKTLTEPFMTMFRDEAALVAKLRHPSCPTFLDYLESEHGQLLVLSFIEGVPLDKVLSKGGPIEDEHICWILDRILSGLSYLHGRWGIIHCDLKPANAILDIDDHQVTLVDYGMSTLKPGDTSRAKGGTPGYLPPEFDLGLPPTPASDIYSVGKIGIALAGGNVDNGECPPDMSPHLKSLLLRMIRRDPKQRPQSAPELRDEITTLRKAAFGRDYCVEIFKHRRPR